MRKEGKYGFLFILPWLIGFLAFKAIPLLMSGVLSFMDYNIISSPEFIGLDNFRELADDELFWSSMKSTGLYVLFTVPMKMVFSLFIAYILSSKVRGIGFFRSIYYIPSLMGGSVAISILWRYMFMKDGMINSILATIGIEGPAWLSIPGTAMFVISFQHVWQFGSTMVVFLAALKGMPNSLIEAAEIDGASRKRIFWSVILPYITPVVFFNLMTNLVTAFQEFNSPFVITAGGPYESTYLMSMMIYENAFRYLNMGLSCAISLILFVIIVSFTLILFGSSRYWVNYQD